MRLTWHTMSARKGVLRFLSMVPNYVPATTIYDVLRPVYCSTMILGILPLNAIAKIFKSNKLLLMWYGLIAAFCLVIALTRYSNLPVQTKLEKNLVYKIFVLGTESISILYTIVLFTTGFFLKNKVNHWIINSSSTEILGGPFVNLICNAQMWYKFKSFT